VSVFCLIDLFRLDHYRLRFIDQKVL
jgi:hypothetical protein